MYTLALRISELSCYSPKFDHSIQFYDVRFDSTQVHVTIRSSKHNTRPMSYTFQCDSRLFWHLSEYTRFRGSFAGPFFCFPDGHPVTRQYFANRLKEDLKSLGLDHRFYNTHSFRVGRTSDLALGGASDRQIAIIGRWQSDAFREYIRPTHIHL